MSGLWSSLGALILSYFVSRLLWHVMRAMPSPLRLFATHGGSFALLAGTTGLLRAYGRTFAFDQAMLYVLPTLIWFVFDYQRGRARPQHRA